MASGPSQPLLTAECAAGGRGGRALLVLGPGRCPTRPTDQAERVARRVGEHILAVELGRSQGQHPRCGGGHIPLDYHVEMNLLRHRWVRPGRGAVVGRELAGQPQGRVLVETTTQSSLS